MTREEAIKLIQNLIDQMNENGYAEIDSFHEDALLMAIKVLEQEPCEDAISREDALLCLTGEFEYDKEYRPEELIAMFGNRLKGLPPVTPTIKIGRGKWKKTTDEYCYWYECSVCGCKVPKNEWGADYFSSFCPECGEPMEVDE